MLIYFMGLQGFDPNSLILSPTFLPEKHSSVLIILSGDSFSGSSVAIEIKNLE